MTIGDIFKWRAGGDLPHQRWLARQGGWSRCPATFLMALPIFAAVTFLLGESPSQHVAGIVGGSIGVGLAAMWFPGSAS